LAVCIQSRGRKAKPLPAVVRRQWSAKNDKPPPASGVGSTEQAWFSLLCGHPDCSIMLQIKTVCQREEAALRCRVHSTGTSSDGSRHRGLSQAQRAAVELLRQLAAGSITVEQYRMLPVQKPIDIVLEDFGVMIEVDGAQHAQSSTGWGEPAGAQHERDRQLDRLVLSMGLRLLRLHHQDAACWHKHVLAAMKKVQEQPQCSFVWYTASYPASSRVA
jgi:very-short-patch-repair endonuclease